MRIKYKSYEVIERHAYNSYLIGTFENVDTGEEYKMNFKQNDDRNFILFSHAGHYDIPDHLAVAFSDAIEELINKALGPEVKMLISLKHPILNEY